jgi:2-polyprenyl-3-methyl-5-hydroxy-6-metoxy-1,4-benzoquinol methylase
VCSRPAPELLHASPLPLTLTSESKLRQGRLHIHLCGNCAHVMSDEGGLTDVAGYYDAEYDSLLDVPDADDLYDLDADLQPIYRSQVELDTLARLADVPPKGRLLDYGCGKGGFLARFHRRFPGWELTGLDVSERYRPFVEAVTGPGRFHACPLAGVPAVEGPFDLVTMFFVAEHLVDPQTTLRAVAALLAPGGLLYLAVPNVLVNSIDAFLADHLSHFSAPSLTVLLHRAGLRPVVLSEHHQLGQLVVMAAREPAFVERAAERVANDLVSAYAMKIREAVGGWVDCARRVEEFLRGRTAEGSLAVYGAGVFGSYLALNAGAARDAITCFVDQNPFKVGKQHMGRPIVHPGQLPSGVSDLLVGLNPGRARDILRQAGLLDRPRLRLFFP